LLILIAVAVAVSVGYIGAMLHRDQPHLGMIGLMILQSSGIPAAAYCVLSG